MTEAEYHKMLDALEAEGEAVPAVVREIKPAPVTEADWKWAETVGRKPEDINPSDE